MRIRFDKACDCEGQYADSGMFEVTYLEEATAGRKLVDFYCKCPECKKRWKEREKPETPIKNEKGG